MKHYEKKDNPQLWFDFAPEYEQQPFYNEPKDDNERFVNAQSKWIETGDAKAWGDMWSILEILARKALTIELHNNKLKFTSEKKEQIVIDTVAEILARYKKWRGYRIDYAVTQVMHCVRFNLFEKQKKEKFETEFIKYLQSEKDEQTALFLAQREVMEGK